MATLRQIYDLARESTNLQPRVIAAMRRKANFVMNESPAVETRVALAKDVLQKAEDHVGEFMTQIADNATAQTSAYSGGPLNTDDIADNDIIYIIDATWDLVASL